MGRVVSILGGVGCLGLAGAAGYIALEPGPSVPPVAALTGLVVDPPGRDFGEVGQHETLTAEFRVTNRYPGPVDVVEVLKSCSCAEAELEPKALGPGDVGVLRVAWKTYDKRGPVSDTVLVSYRAAGVPEVQPVSLRAVAVPSVVFEPAEVVLPAGRPGRSVVRFRSGRGQPFRLLSAHTSRGPLTATVDPDRGEVAVGYDPAQPGGDAREHRLVVQCTSPQEPWATVPVVVR